jgi:DNA repair protein RadC
METTETYLNELSITYTKKLFNQVSIKCSRDAELVIRDMYNHTKSEIELKEYFFIILLNRANEVIGYYKLSEGGIHSADVDLRIAFATALKSLAVGIIMVHNHPSGNLVASEQDIKLTKKFINAGDMLDIKVFDHIIISSQSYYSLSDEGMI